MMQEELMLSNFIHTTRPCTQKDYTRNKSTNVTLIIHAMEDHDLREHKRNKKVATTPFKGYHFDYFSDYAMCIACS